MARRLIFNVAGAMILVVSTMVSLILVDVSGTGAAPSWAHVVMEQPVAIAPGALHTGSKRASIPGAHSTTVTDNWGGYVATGGNHSFANSQASFVVPSLVSCGPTENSSSVFWAGLDGWASSTVEQAGVAADCNSGVPQYFAWWEDVPLGSGAFLGVRVSSGDLVQASATYMGGSSYQLQVVDSTSNTMGSVTISDPGTSNSSAECIAEDPSGSATALPYADYGTVTFTGCTANGVPIGAFSPISTDTATPQGTLDAVTSGLVSNTSFSVSRITSTQATPQSQAQPSLAQPVVGMASTPSGNGYWLASANGAVTAKGQAVFYGSMAGVPLNSPIVHIVASYDGQGYWLVAADGGTFAFGDAQFYGSMGGRRLNAPVVDLAPTPDGSGYWLVASDGGIFAFGSAPFYGSMGATHLNRPVVGIATDRQTGGYWEVASDGGMFAFGAPFFGSTATFPLNAPILSMAPSGDGRGYWMAASDGGTFAFGDAEFRGSMGGQPLLAPIVDIDSDPSTGGYWMVNTVGSVYAFDAPTH